MSSTGQDVVGTIRATIERVGDVDRLVALYLYGSFPWGGYDQRTSDIDLIAIVDERAPVMASYQQVRGLGLALATRFHADISTTPLDQVGDPVLCRPYILRAAADHGRLVHGRDVLPRGGPLDPAELLTAVDFDLRQLSRNFAGLVDTIVDGSRRARIDCWAQLIQKDVRAHFVRMSQLVSSHRDDVPFVGGYRAAIDQAAGLFPALRSAPVAAAVDPADGSPDVAALMETLVCLRELLTGPALAAAGIAPAT